MANARMYNDPAGNVPSEIGSQIRQDHYLKKALIEARKSQYFMPLADVTSMPKHMGKKMRRYHYLPLLDDANINDQGIDAAGVAITGTQYFVSFPNSEFSVANGVKTATASAINANIDDGGSAATIAVAGADGSGGTGLATITLTKTVVKYANSTTATAATSAVPGSTAHQGSGNLYGSSKDIGTIPGKLPALSETGGRVNRVGFTRKEVEGTLEKFGFFDEYTQESMDFDSDADLMQHINREMINGATEISEDALQIDLLNSAGVVRFAGDATSSAEVDGSDVVTYNDLLRLSITLDDNRTPKQTKVITGTRMVDTRTIAGSRVLYCGSELQPTLEGMTDLHSNPAFVPVHQYAAGSTVLNGEIGSIGYFRVVIVPEMMKWAGAGADATSNTTHYATGDNFDVFPMLCVGDGSFSTIGFQTDGKTVKFVIRNKKPGEETTDRSDPYGELGFMSIKWYYGFLLLRPERLGLIKTAAEL